MAHQLPCPEALQAIWFLIGVSAILSGQTYSQRLQGVFLTDAFLFQAHGIFGEVDKETMFFGSQMRELAHTAECAGDAKFGERGEGLLVHHERGNVRKD